MLLLSGDSHEFVSDNPISGASPFHALHATPDVASFHRIVVHGSTEPLEWLHSPSRAGTNRSSATSFAPVAWQRITPLP